MPHEPTIFDLIAERSPISGQEPGIEHPAPEHASLTIAGVVAALARMDVATLIPIMHLPPGPRGTRLWVYDTEVFPNLILHVFTDGAEVHVFHHGQWPALRAFVSDPSKALVGFNNAAYDDVLLRFILDHPDQSNADGVSRLHTLSVQTITGDISRALRFGRVPWGLSIDLHQLLNGGASLKEWECRMGFGLVAESPVDFARPVALHDLAEVLRYCCNDVHATCELLRRNLDLITMRQRIHELYRLTSDQIFVSSEARIAESTMLELLRRDSAATIWSLRDGAKRNPDNAPQIWPFSSLIAARVRFTSAPFAAVFTALQSAVLTVDQDFSIRIAVPAIPDLVARVAGTAFQLGVGGIHSLDGPGTFHADAEFAIVDLDVVSYYPSLILNEGWYPRHLGSRFLIHLRAMRDQRVAAKQAGDKRTANALKIVINSVYGKLNDQFSGIRSIPDAFRVTINGQLMLLMLVERLAALGAVVLGANTDGVTIRMARTSLGDGLPQALRAWEHDTGLSLEEVRYRSFFRRDVNNYLAVGEDGSAKTKGVFGDGAKADGAIIRRAAIAYLIAGRDPADTIAAADRVEDFLFYQRCRRDALLFQDSNSLGRTVRWYCTYADPPIVRRALTSTGGGTTVNHGHHARLANDIRGLTVADLQGLDRSYYIAQARELIAAVGVDLLCW